MVSLHTLHVGAPLLPSLPPPRAASPAGRRADRQVWSVWALSRLRGEGYPTGARSLPQIPTCVTLNTDTFKRARGKTREGGKKRRKKNGDAISSRLNFLSSISPGSLQKQSFSHAATLLSHHFFFSFPNPNVRYVCVPLSVLTRRQPVFTGESADSLPL